MANKYFPQEFLMVVQLPTRGACAGLTTRANDTDTPVDLLAFESCDQDRHYFISSCSIISAGLHVQWYRVWQVTDVVLVNLELDCPKAAAMYYSAYGKIDQYNHCHQDVMNLEKKMETKLWHRRVNMSIFGIIILQGPLNCHDWQPILQ